MLCHLSIAHPTKNYRFNSDLFKNSPDTVINGDTIAPLPVGLVSFTAQRSGKINKLNWTTSQEINTQKFVIEHCTDGRSFTLIEEMAATGSNTLGQSYSFIHTMPALGINYYRLRTIDFTGHEVYSYIKNIRNEGTADVAVYPNPVKDLLTLNITSDRNDVVVITVNDMSGKTLYVETKNIIAGTNYIKINSSTYRTGMYIVSMKFTQDALLRKVNKF